jgi:hypothetical protein
MISKLFLYLAGGTSAICLGRLIKFIIFVFLNDIKNGEVYLKKFNSLLFIFNLIFGLLIGDGILNEILYIKIFIFTLIMNLVFYKIETNI